MVGNNTPLSKQASLSAIFAMLAGRAGNTLATSAVRSKNSPLRSYYSTMARHGLEEGLDGAKERLLPTLGRPILQRFGPATGLLDYDLARTMGEQGVHMYNSMKAKYPALQATSARDLFSKFQAIKPEKGIYDVAKSLNMRPREILSEIRKLSPESQMLLHSRGANFQSPVMRHLSDALTKYPTSGIADWTKRFYSSKPITSQFRTTTAFGGLSGMTQSLAMNPTRPFSAIAHGAASAMETAPEALMLNRAAAGHMNLLTAGKASLLGLGRNTVNAPSLSNKAIYRGASLYDANAREFLLAGKDVANMGKNLGTDKRLLALGEKMNHTIDHHGTPKAFAHGVKTDIVDPIAKKTTGFLEDRGMHWKDF